MVMIIVAILATLMCVEASAQRKRTVTSFTGRHTFLMSVEANAMADTDPIDGSFKADFGGLAKLTYFKTVTTSLRSLVIVGKVSRLRWLMPVT